MITNDGSGIDTESMYWQLDPLNPQDTGGYGHWYFSWMPVSPDYVHHWFRHRIGNHDQVLCGGEINLSSSSPGVTWYPKGYTGHEVENSILDGSLEKSFQQEIQGLVVALDERETEWRASAQEKSGKVIARLRKESSFSDGEDVGS